MAFLNKKEQVIDLELTTYGRFLYSQGLLKPKFYSFYDDDVIYDIRYSNAQGTAQHRGTAEAPNISQNEIVERIKRSPQTNVQYSFSTIASTGKNFLAGNKDNDPCLSEAEREEEIYLPDQGFSEREYSMGLSLGTSKYGNRYAPAWAIGIAKGELRDAKKYLEHSQQIKIPQLSCEIDSNIYLDKNKGQYYINMENFLLDIDEVNSSNTVESEYEIELFEEIPEEYVFKTIDEHATPGVGYIRFGKNVYQNLIASSSYVVNDPASADYDASQGGLIKTALGGAHGSRLVLRSKPHGIGETTSIGNKHPFANTDSEIIAWGEAPGKFPLNPNNFSDEDGNPASSFAETPNEYAAPFYNPVTKIADNMVLWYCGAAQPAIAGFGDAPSNMLFAQRLAEAINAVGVHKAPYLRPYTAVVLTSSAAVNTAGELLNASVDEPVIKVSHNSVGVNLNVAVAVGSKNYPSIAGSVAKKQASFAAHAAESLEITGTLTGHKDMIAPEFSVQSRDQYMKLQTLSNWGAEVHHPVVYDPFLSTGYGTARDPLEKRNIDTVFPQNYKKINTYYPEFFNKINAKNKKYHFLSNNATIGKLTDKFAEFYFDLKVDQNISKEDFCDARVIDKDKSLYVKRYIDCGDTLVEQYPIYDQPSSDPGEPCE